VYDVLHDARRLQDNPDVTAAESEKLLLDVCRVLCRNGSSVLHATIHLLRDNVAAGCQQWTNTGCESVNQLLKLTTQWRFNKIS